MYVKIPVRVCRYANARDCKMKIDCVKPYSGSVYTLLVACVFAALACAAATTDAEPVSAERQHTWWAGPGYWDRRHAAKLKEIASGADTRTRRGCSRFVNYLKTFNFWTRRQKQ